MIEMPKGHRSARSQGYYRLSPSSTTLTTPTTPYAPVSSRPSLANIPSASYYPPGTLTMSSQQQQAYSQSSSGYPNGIGGPVQHPMHTHPSQQQYHSMSHQPPAPQVSIRASSGAWNPQDDSTLMAARAQGMNWAPIQQAYFPNKTPNACRKRHERLMERRSADDWDGMKLENMAKHYMDMRKEIWAPLAAATGEKWSVVEQKCMSQGLKNLQTSARSYSRRERLLDATPTTTSSTYPSSSTHSQSQSLSHTSNNPTTNGGFEQHTDDSGYAEDHELDAASYHDHEQDNADGASERSGGSIYDPNPHHHSSQSHHHSSRSHHNSHSHPGHSGHGHAYSQSGGSATSLNMGSLGNVGMSMGGVVGMDSMGNLRGGYGGMQGYQMGHGGGRIPSMDMGIDSIINRTPTGR